MCGFVGFTNHIKDDGTVLHSMMNKIIHRGPDSEGMYVGDAACLGFRRLSIIDLEGGDQPMYNEDRSLVITFNGEIYNFLELREELLAAGHVFQTRSDTEVLVHGFEEWGEELPKRLRGMYAFVIHNIKDGSLFGCRDIFGIKPFYYATMGETFIFGSEIKGFLPHPDFEKGLNEEALAHYLSFQYSAVEETFFKNVYKLAPGHFFTYKGGEMKITRYFRPDFKAEDGTLEEWAELVDKAVRESVKAHKIADVEVGSFLSSGIDSSYIAEAACVDKTFTVGFKSKNDQYNEINYAKDFAKTINVENIAKEITPEEYWENFPHIQYQMDEPLADPAAIALYFVSKLAAEHVKVVMSGEGADELFGGYRIYQEPITLTAYDKLPFALRRIFSKIASVLPKKHGINYIVRRGKLIEERFIGNAYIFSKKERNRILKVAKSAADPTAICKKYYDEVPDYDTVTKMQYLDLHMWLVGDILLKADKTSMANSLELRVPFLDKKVLELAERIPMKHRVNTKTTKLALRLAAEKTLPERTARKDKLGFPVPIRVWLKEEGYSAIVKEAFTSETAKKYFNTNELLKLLKRHKAGKEDLSRKIWTVYTFLVWHKEFFEN